MNCKSLAVILMEITCNGFNPKYSSLFDVMKVIYLHAFYLSYSIEVHYSNIKTQREITLNIGNNWLGVRFFISKEQRILEVWM